MDLLAQLAGDTSGARYFACTVRCEVRGNVGLDVQRWRAEPDGRVWRFAIGGLPGGLSVATSEADLAALRASFRWRDTPGPPARRKRAWWPF